MTAKTTASEQTAIKKTKQWLEQSVIKHQFCPYAKKPHEDGVINYLVYSGHEPIELLEQLVMAMIMLDKKPSTELETTLIIIDSEQAFLNDFFEFLDVLDIANHCIEKPRSFIRRFSDTFESHYASAVTKSWFDSYQLAHFHPNYIFAGSAENDRENFTNRSPYPTLHILRNSSIDTVKMTDDKAEHIVERNCQHLAAMSDKEFNELVALAKQAD